MMSWLASMRTYFDIGDTEWLMNILGMRAAVQSVRSRPQQGCPVVLGTTLEKHGVCLGRLRIAGKSLQDGLLQFTARGAPIGGPRMPLTRPSAGCDLRSSPAKTRFLSSLRALTKMCRHTSTPAATKTRGVGLCWTMAQMTCQKPLPLGGAMD